MSLAEPEPMPLPVPVLSEAERGKQDRSDDALFYAEPRFVQHLDGAFRSRLTALYAERLGPDAVVLDLMSSWVSHLPENGRYRQVIGHGLNGRELEANPRLDRHWVQNLNQDQRLPLESASVDAALIVAGWQYLQQPEAVATELRAQGIPVETGAFAAHMQVELLNDGPVTFVLDSRSAG